MKYWVHKCSPVVPVLMADGTYTDGGEGEGLTCFGYPILHLEFSLAGDVIDEDVEMPTHYREDEKGWICTIEEGS